MAWPAESGSLGVIRSESTRRRSPRRRARSRVFDFPARRPTFTLDGRGRYRVFNAAGYRFYRSATGPPRETDPPFATNATLPHEPADTYADGTWYLSASYFNGVIDSGFLPLGSRGETYLRLDLAAGVEVGSPSAAVADVRIEQLAGGIPRIVALYYEPGDNRAEEWAVAYTFNGTDPAEDAPDYTATMPTAGAAILDYNLAAQSHGTVVKARVQTRRSDGDGGWIYSDNSEILTLTIDTSGPTASLAGRNWPGPIGE